LIWTITPSSGIKNSPYLPPLVKPTSNIPHMSNSALIAELRTRAVATLCESTELFEKSLSLLRAGDSEQAGNMQELARSKRDDSIWLMNEASRLEGEVSPETSY
jgi:hypothetical protein